METAPVTDCRSCVTGAAFCFLSAPSAPRPTPSDTRTASVTFSISSGGSAPMRSRRRRLSSVRICSASTTLSFCSPVLPAGTGTWVGRRALFTCPVMASTITVGL